LRLARRGHLARGQSGPRDFLRIEAVREDAGDDRRSPASGATTSTSGRPRTRHGCRTVRGTPAGRHRPGPGARRAGRRLPRRLGRTTRRGSSAAPFTSPTSSSLGLWAPDPDLGHIDMAAVERRVREVLAAYNVRSSPSTRGASRTSSPASSRRHPVVQWPTNSLDAWPGLRGVLPGRHEQDHHPRRESRLGAAHRQRRSQGGPLRPRIVKESKTSARKIDLAVCAVGAYSEAPALAATDTELPDPVAVWA